MKAVIQNQDDILNARILSECNAVREDTAHKFTLQASFPLSLFLLCVFAPA
jgi:hypothetical protein